MKVKVASFSISPTLRSKKKNLARIGSLIKEDDLAIFPELYLTGYSIGDDVSCLAEPLDGPSVKAASKIAGDVGSHILFGMAEVERDSHGKKFYNSSVLVSPDGQVWRYRKIHPAHFGPFEEKAHFSPGNALEVAETKVGRIGMTICYDLFFPELTKTYAMKGADMVANIAASPHTTRRFFERVMPARAIESTVFFAFSNNVGVYQDMMFWGGGRIISPRGDVLAQGEAMEETAARAKIDLEDVRRAREMRPTLTDTNPGFLRWQG
ncbi:MAG: carbon-nitrogen hydrolase family protein [Candidatus Thermoplasmatota archaeon]|nr:carbon-nitrogen hydrolase family protein [Candidatus Thermoplasmatota archaeon]